MSAHNKKGWRRSASLRDKRCFSLEADAQANPELALVDSFARQVGYARNRHEIALLGNAAGGLVDRARIGGIVIGDVKVRMIRAPAGFQPAAR